MINFLSDLFKLNKGIRRKSYNKQQVIISLTTISERINGLPETIETLLKQTLKPNKIILWIDENNKEVPLNLALKEQQKRGVEVRYCKDIGPHTKLIPSLKEFPEAIIITVDDDIIYPCDLLEKLYASYINNPTMIHCTRARRIPISNIHNGNYNEDWPNYFGTTPSIYLLPLGVGGVLYPPKIFPKDVFNLDLMQELTPKADDIWFRAMTLLHGVECQRVNFTKTFFPIRPNSQEVELGQYNVREGGNDIQIRSVFSHYRLWDKLEKSKLVTKLG